MKEYKFSDRSLRKMNGVHNDLLRVVVPALSISSIDFGIGEGLRTFERQKLLVKDGKSKTMNSRHLPKIPARGRPFPVSHAVDLIAYVDGKVSWKEEHYHEIAAAMKNCAKNIDVDIEWGGEWSSFFDGPHFQLNWKSYPLRNVS